MEQLLQEKNNTQIKKHRLHFLDGLRGLAILLVVFYHAYSSRWMEVLPYQNQYDGFALIHFGNYGVQLFFLISGFVIAMTLEKCKSFWDFMLRRWLRLFPAMLVVSLVILVTAPIFAARPYGVPMALDLVPGLLLIEPEFFRALFGYHQDVLEGSFWTLFVEMKFYIVAGLLYFSIGAKRMVWVLILMFFSSIALEFIGPHLPTKLSEQLTVIYHYLNYRHYGWFAAGALFYQYYVSNEVKYWLGGMLVALISARCLGGVMNMSMVVASGLVFIFGCALLSHHLQRVLSHKVLVFVGFISYPFYLLHEQAMVSMIIQLHAMFPSVPNYLLPIAPILLIMAVAWLIARLIEPFLRTQIKRLISH